MALCAILYISNTAAHPRYKHELKLVIFVFCSLFLYCACRLAHHARLRYGIKTPACWGLSHSGRGRGAVMLALAQM